MVDAGLARAFYDRADDERTAFVSARPDGFRSISFAALLERSRDTSRGLCRYPWGSPAVVATADPISFVVGFLAAVLAGLTPVPLPARLRDSPRNAARFVAVVRSLARPIVLTSTEHRAELVAATSGTAAIFDVEELRAGDGARPYRADRRPAPRYLQYTSGSSRTPRAVEVSHENLAAQVDQAGARYREHRDCVAVHWVPLFHDMGLVAAMWRPLAQGYLSVLLDPHDFVRDPLHWVLALSRWSATHTSAPDFGYALTAARALDDARLGDIDLRALRVARNAGERVRHTSLAAFQRAFEPHGLGADVLSPSYGLAEATLTVTGHGPGDTPTILRAGREKLRSGHFQQASAGDEAISVVSCGPPVADTSLLVLGSAGEVLPEGQVGDVWISGPQVSRTALNRHVAGREGHATGDEGFLWNGSLYLLGRSSERLQVRGENYYPSDLEAELEQHETALRPGRVAVFVEAAPAAGCTGLCVIAEWRRGADLNPDALYHSGRGIVRTLARVAGLRAEHVRIVPAGTLPLTTSGKVRRSSCEQLVHRGSLWALDRDDACPTLQQGSAP